ncbi:pyridoxal phosphate-dependent decarboxylase family protein [Lentisalinibacter orientalis]|uniref:pyridoxal phosphate-dependent decarboxylase family protein n=1 Tax=Lentisalinibacter orientalis TaxID=2992241 RepID=UPI0038644CC5
MYTEKELEALARAAAELAAGLPADPQREDPAADPALVQVLLDTARRLHDNFPYHHPLYAGQMLKPPHPAARLAYALAMTVNPNNHALDGGRASSAMEKEAVGQLAAMFGWDTHLGHLTGGGTVANLEALWIARERHPDRGIAASAMAHYTHRRLSDVLRMPFTEVAADAHGRMDPDALDAAVRAGGIGTVVATLGTTGTGSTDPLPEILEIAERHGLRVHVDAAYGGYFRLLDSLSPPAVRAFAVVDRADSIVIDPHKHGLQPYGCGCILFRDPAVAVHYRHESAYTYFTSDDLHLGEISLECSRAGAAAVALWATQRLLPPEPGGEFAAGLARCRQAAVALHRALADDPAFLTLMPPDLDIVVWAPSAATAGAVSRASRRCFERAAESGLHLALMELPSLLAARWWPGMEFDDESVTVLRSVLMKPEHDRALPAILEHLRAAAG